MKVREFLGTNIKYDRGCNMIFAIDDNQGMQLILDVRGWGAIQNLFKTEGEALKFQDEMAEFIVEAINEKLKTVDS